MDSSGTTATISVTATPANTSNHVQISRKRVKVSSQRSLDRPQKEIQWRNPAQAKIYHRRLIDSLRNLNINSSTADDDQSPPKPQSPRQPPPPRAIKDAADAALAMTARGQSRWSRAILSRRWRMRKVVMAKPKVKKRKTEREGEGGVRREKKKVRDRLRLLGHLVPGCRKVSMADLLEETADYVAALELQVKAMKALSDALSSSTSASSGSPPPSDHHADHAATTSSHDN